MNSQRRRFVILFVFVCVVFISPCISSANFREGFGLQGGFYSPSEDSTNSIYGSGPMFGVQYKLAISTHTGLVTSVSVLQKQGNPYNDSTFIDTDPSSSLTFIPVEVSYTINLIPNQPETTRRVNSLYVGVGINHVWTRERAPGSPLAKGNAFGSQFLVGTTFSISKGFDLGLELKYMVNRPLMKLDTGRDYDVELNGAQAQMTFGWHF